MDKSILSESVKKMWEGSGGGGIAAVNIKKNLENR